MSVDREPRYVVSCDGLDVYDTWNCWRAVYRTPRHLGAPGMSALAIGAPLFNKAAAHAKCAALNREHETWMAGV